MKVDVGKGWVDGRRVGTGFRFPGFLCGATGAGGGFRNGCANTVKANNPLTVKNKARFMVENKMLRRLFRQATAVNGGAQS